MLIKYPLDEVFDWSPRTRSSETVCRSMPAVRVSPFCYVSCVSCRLVTLGVYPLSLRVGVRRSRWSWVGRQSWRPRGESGVLLRTGVVENGCMYRSSSQLSHSVSADLSSSVLGLRPIAESFVIFHNHPISYGHMFVIFEPFSGLLWASVVTFHRYPFSCMSLCCLSCATSRQYPVCYVLVLGHFLRLSPSFMDVGNRFSFCWSVCMTCPNFHVFGGNI